MKALKLQLSFPQSVCFVYILIMEEMKGFRYILVCQFKDLSIQNTIWGREVGTVIHFLVTFNANKSVLAVVIIVVILVEPSQKYLVIQIERGCHSYFSPFWQKQHWAKSYRSAFSCFLKWRSFHKEKKKKRSPPPPRKKTPTQPFPPKQTNLQTPNKQKNPSLYYFEVWSNSGVWTFLEKCNKQVLKYPVAVNFHRR